MSRRDILPVASLILFMVIVTACAMVLAGGGR